MAQIFTDTPTWHVPGSRVHHLLVLCPGLISEITAFKTNTAGVETAKEAGSLANICPNCRKKYEGMAERWGDINRTRLE